MSNYAKAFKELLKQGAGINDLANANRIALNDGKITLAEYQEAAQELVKAYLN